MGDALVAVGAIGFVDTLKLSMQISTGVSSRESTDDFKTRSSETVKLSQQWIPNPLEAEVAEVLFVHGREFGDSTLEE